jgi:peptide/nickel transport system substrate-binding protein
MKRRDILKAAAAPIPASALAAPALAQPAGANVLRIIPQANLTSLDPIWTTATITRHHSYLVYDQITAVDSTYTPRPQMAAGWTIEDDGRTYTFTLRDGLRFHDGEPVRALDCVASINRWGKRDQFGQELLAVTDELSALDDKRFRFRLKRAFPLLLTALGKENASPCFVMPERVAMTDAFTQIREAIGSGPYRFIPGEWVPGAKVAYQRNPAYVPRQEAPDWISGGRHARVERIEWNIIPDPATAAAAMQQGEADFWELPLHDLLPSLRRNRNLVVHVRDQLGTYAMMRFNHLHPPFNNVAIRRAVAMAVNQEDFMRSVVGDDPAGWRRCLSFWTCGTANESLTGSELMATPSVDRARAALAAAGYNNERVVLIAPSDFPTIFAVSQVTNDLLRRIGMNVEFVSVDWGTVVQRRASREPVERGGWSIFHTTWSGADHLNPAGHQPIRGNGTAGWFGWPTDEATEQHRAAWFAAPDAAAQKAATEGMQARSMATVPYVPLGAFLHPNVFRRNVTGLIDGPALVFYNMQKSA